MNNMTYEEIKKLDIKKKLVYGECFYDNFVYLHVHTFELSAQAIYIYIYIYICVCVYSRYFNLFGQVDFTVLSQAQVLANTLPCIRSCISICMEVYLD